MVLWPRGVTIITSGGTKRQKLGSSHPCCGALEYRQTPTRIRNVWYPPSHTKLAAPNPESNTDGPDIFVKLRIETQDPVVIERDSRKPYLYPSLPPSVSPSLHEQLVC